MASFPLLDQLNPAQRAAVVADQGHLCINAAAGTGKTSTVAARILYLQLERGVSPGSILAVSFSRAARGNLLERVEQYVNLIGRGSNVTTLTLHGLAYRVLRMGVGHGETWLRPGFDVIAGSRDRLNPLFERHASFLVNDLRDGYPADARPALYSRALDLVRQGHPCLERAVVDSDELNDLVDEAITVNWDAGSRSRVSLRCLQTVWKRYNRLLNQNNCIDYPGMLSECIRVLYNEGPTLLDFQQGLRYLIVDEYQDTSRAQEELITLLAGDHVSVNVVGDSDQAIYTFNGSDAGNILRFRDHMSGGTLPNLPPVDLTWNYRSTPNILTAANRVLHAAGAHKRELQPAPDGVAEAVVGYRRRNLPVTRVHARELDVAARWVATEVRRLLIEEGIKANEVAVLVRKDTEYSPQGQAVRAALATLGLEVEVQDRDPQRTALVLDTMHTFLNERFGENLTDLIARVKARECDQDFSGITVEEALAVLEEARKAGAVGALEAADMVYDMGAPEQSAPDITGVQVRTIHSAKGLEFRVVFLMYLGDKEFPSGARPDLAEEQRLYYVGITRAMERLYVVGRHGVAFPSFFDEIAGDGVELVEATPLDNVSVEYAVEDEVRRQVEAARRRQKELEAQRRKRL